MASRIFITNLPPNLKEDDFKKHFSDMAQLTDAKLIPKRRFGYVGYKTPELALKAVKYYNKSFIRMSKIKVELARPTDEVQPRKKARIETPSSAIEAIQVHNVPDNSDPKLQEFLNVMAPSSRSKTWANEDDLATDQPVPIQMSPAEQNQEDASDDEYQTMAKKRKRTNDLDDNIVSEESGFVQAGVQAVSVENTEPEAGGASDNDKEVESELLQPSNKNGISENQVAGPDTDWLRSKTSRLLGLVEEDEMDLDREIPKQTIANELNSPVDHSDFDTSRTMVTSAQQGTIEQQDRNDVEADQAMEANSGTGRLFLRNLSYETTEADLETLFANHGLVEEVHISKDTRSGNSKGFAYIQFSAPEEALSAREALDGKAFQGRLLHILSAKAKRLQGLDEYEISKLPLKKQREIRRKAEASTATFKWNSMYMNPDAILSSVASRLGVSKTDVLDPTSSDSAVKQAHAEMDVIKETKKYFAKHGVNLDAFKGREQSKESILVKNFPYGTSAEELKKMFEAYGTVSRLLIPPAATIAIVEMENSTQAKSAFNSLAYRKFKDSVLFLEKAPKSLFNSKAEQEKLEEDTQKASAMDLLEQSQDASLPLTISTLHVRNLNFSTTSAELRSLFMPLNGFLSATVKTKTNPKKPEQTLSMGYGFVEFRTKPDALSAMAALNGHTLAGHDLQIKESNKATDAAEERRKEDAAKKLAAQRTKIVIRNLPFEASKKDVRALVSPYGQLRTVRVPQKFGGGSRGFAFAEFVTTREAENAIKALTDVHLLGRRLNLEYAAGDTVDAEEEIEKMSKKARRQADKMAIQNLTGGGRKKFSVHQEEDADL